MWSRRYPNAARSDSRRFNPALDPVDYHAGKLIGDYSRGSRSESQQLLDRQRSTWPRSASSIRRATGGSARALAYIKMALQER